MQRVILPADLVWLEISICSFEVTIDRDTLWQIQHYRDCRCLMLSGEHQQRLPRWGLNVGRIDHSQLRALKSPLSNQVKQVKGVLRSRLIILVIRDEQPAEV